MDGRVAHFSFYPGAAARLRPHFPLNGACLVCERGRSLPPGAESSGVRSGDSSLFQQYFPKSRFVELDWYGGDFRGTSSVDGGVSVNNANSFQLFSAEGLHFLFLHLECNAPDNVPEWADEVLRKYPDRRAIITTHMGLGPRDKPQHARDYFDAPKGRMIWKKCHGERGNTPQQLWDKCFRKHGSLFMICCGDQSRTQAMHQLSRGDRGNAVHELLSDYGVNGLRVMRFVPKVDRIEIRTWNPLTGTLTEGTKVVPDIAQHQFDLPYAMTRDAVRPSSPRPDPAQ